MVCIESAFAADTRYHAFVGYSIELHTNVVLRVCNETEAMLKILLRVLVTYDVEFERT